MARFGGYYAASQRTSDECDVADKIHQFMAGRLVGVEKRLFVDISEYGSVVAGNTHFVGDVVEFFLGLGAFIDHDGVVEIAALDEACFKERLYVAHEHESAGRSDFLGEFRYMVECGILVVEYVGLEIDFHVEAEFVVGQKHELRAGFGIYDFNLVLHIEEVLVGILFFESYALDGVDKRLGAAVEYRNFRTVDTDQAVVHPKGIESRHCVLNGADSDVAFAYDCAALCCDDVFCESINGGFTFYVCALYLVSVVVGSRAESGFKVSAGMKTFAFDCELAF